MWGLTPTIGVSNGDGVYFTYSSYDKATSIAANVSSLMTHYSPLPAGLSLSPSGVISGTPTSVGSYNFSVTVTDSGTPQKTVTRSFHLDAMVKTAAPSSPSLLPGSDTGASN